MRKCICCIAVLGIMMFCDVSAQNLSGEVNNMSSSLKKNFGKYNILGGVNTMSLVFDDGQGRSIRPLYGNVYGYYIGGSTYSVMSEKKTSFWASSTQFIFGKQTINAPSATALIQDSLSIYNFSNYSGYFFKAPFRFTYNRKMNKNLSWGISFGAVLQVPMMYGTISNGSESEDLTSVYRQYLVDYGWTAGLEFGFRAGFLACDFTQGISNMSDTGGGTSITDNGSISLTLGYRFGSPQGKKDAELINSVKKKLSR